MEYDLSQARLAYDFVSGEYRKSSGNFACFSPAYVSTNEDVRDALLMLKPKPGARVLTVAGSGDQALFYKLAGAGHVDTFDITFNAKMMMDIKTAAIQVLDRNEYLRLFGQISHSRDIYKIPEYKKVVDYIPDDTREYVRQMRGVRLTRGGMSYMDTVLFKNEYDDLAKKINQPFNFIWTDLTDLSSKLTQSYDQIYLSNILQYRAQPEYITNVISDLATRLVSGGKILVNVAPWFDAVDITALRFLQNKIAQCGVGTVDFIKNHVHHMCVMRKR